MSYLPQLRDSLVKAAERQAEPAPVRSRRRGFRGFGLIAASLAALVVAAAVLVLTGHRAAPRPTVVPSASASGSARAAAVTVLTAFRPPRGAAMVGSDLSRRRWLRSVPVALPTRDAVDVHRYYRVNRDFATVFRSISPQHSLPGFGPSAWSSESTGAGSADSTGMQWETATYRLAAAGGYQRTFQVSAAPTVGGGTALRVDAVAWRLVPRPLAERVPTVVGAISVQPIGHLPHGAHPPARLAAHPDVALVIALLNAMPLAQPSDGPCPDTRSGYFRLVFLGSGQHPDPVAVVRPSCGTVSLTLRGKAQPTLSWAGDGSAAAVSHWLRLLALTSGSTSTAQSVTAPTP